MRQQRGGQGSPARHACIAAHPLTHPLARSLAHPPTHPPTYPLIRPPTHSPTHQPTHSPTHAPTHLLQLVKELKAEAPGWVSKYARGGSARKQSARKAYIVVDALSGHFASNGWVVWPRSCSVQRRVGALGGDVGAARTRDGVLTTPLPSANTALPRCHPPSCARWWRTLSKPAS